MARTMKYGQFMDALVNGDNPFEPSVQNLSNLPYDQEYPGMQWGSVSPPSPQMISTCLWGNQREANASPSLFSRAGDVHRNHRLPHYANLPRDREMPVAFNVAGYNYKNTMTDVAHRQRADLLNAAQRKDLSPDSGGEGSESPLERSDAGDGPYLPPRIMQEDYLELQRTKIQTEKEQLAFEKKELQLRLRLAAAAVEEAQGVFSQRSILVKGPSESDNATVRSQAETEPASPTSVKSAKSFSRSAIKDSLSPPGSPKAVEPKLVRTISGDTAGTSFSEDAGKAAPLKNRPRAGSGSRNAATKQKLAEERQALQKEREAIQSEKQSLQELKTEIQRDRAKLMLDCERFERSRRLALGESSQQRPDDVFVLNVGGDVTLQVSRSTLTFFEGSHLANMFCGPWERSLPRDSQGRIFLDCKAEIAVPLLEYLRQCRLECGISGSHVNVPLPTFDRPGAAEEFQRLLRYFDLERFVMSHLPPER